LDDITNRFLQFFEDEKISIKWFKTPLIWDNRTLHLRTQYQDRERELKRLPKDSVTKQTCALGSATVNSH